VLLAASGFLVYLPEARKHGWLSLVPTSVLLRLSPHPSAEAARYDPATRTFVPDPMHAELARRDTVGSLTSDQWRYVLDQKGLLQYRRVWPRNMPLVLGIRPCAWIGNTFDTQIRIKHVATGKFFILEQHDGLAGICGHDVSREIPPWEGSNVDVEIGIYRPGKPVRVINCGSPQARRRGQVFDGRISLPIRGVDSIDEAVSPSCGAQLDRLMRSALRVEIRDIPGGGFWGPLPHARVSVFMNRSADPQLDQIAFGFAVEFLRADTQHVIDTTLIRPDIPWLTRTNAAPGESASGWGEASRAYATLSSSEARPYSLRVRGNAEMALRDWDKPSYWSGEFIVPLADVIKR
jgi:hypothetical protein